MPYYVCYKCVCLSVDLLYIYFFYLFKIPNYKGVKIMLIYGLLYAIFCFSDKFQSYDDLCSTTAKTGRSFYLHTKDLGLFLNAYILIRLLYVGGCFVTPTPKFVSRERCKHDSSFDPFKVH